MEVFVTGISHTFVNHKINCSICCSCIGICIGDGNSIWIWLGYLNVLVTGMLYDFSILIANNHLLFKFYSFYELYILLEKIISTFVCVVVVW